MRHSRWLDLACKVAASSDYEKWRTGCVIVKSNSVLSVGINKLKNNPEHAGHSHLCSTHAEIDALSRCANPKGATIYVARMTPAGKIGLARPCGRCWDILWEHKIKDVKWTNN